MENDIQLHHFDGFFHVFASLNLAYAGIKQFRSYMDEQIVRVAKTITHSIRSYSAVTRSQLLVMNGENIASKVVEAKVQRIGEKVDSVCNFIDGKIDRQLEFTEGFKSNFLVATIYALAILALSGWQQSMFLQKFESCLLIMHLALVYILIIFLRTFTPLQNKRVNGIWPIATMALLICLVYIYINWCPYAAKNDTILSINSSILLAQFIVASPYILHMLRIFLGVCFLWFLSFGYRIYVQLRLRRIQSALNLLDPERD